jgi:hypothetical protein
VLRTLREEPALLILRLSVSIPFFGHIHHLLDCGPTCFYQKAPLNPNQRALHPTGGRHRGRAGLVSTFADNTYQLRISKEQTRLDGFRPPLRLTLAKRAAFRLRTVASKSVSTPTEQSPSLLQTSLRPPLIGIRWFCSRFPRLPTQLHGARSL